VCDVQGFAGSDITGGYVSYRADPLHEDRGPETICNACQEHALIVIELFGIIVSDTLLLGHHHCVDVSAFRKHTVCWAC